MLKLNKGIKTKPKPKSTLSFKNCSHVCAYHCVQLSFTTQHITVAIIFSLILQIIIIAQMPTGGKGGTFTENIFLCTKTALWPLATTYDTNQHFTRHHNKRTSRYIHHCHLGVMQYQTNHQLYVLVPPRRPHQRRRRRQSPSSASWKVSSPDLNDYCSSKHMHHRVTNTTAITSSTLVAVVQVNHDFFLQFFMIKSSAVAEMATIYMGRKVGGCCARQKLLASKWTVHHQPKLTA